MPSNRRNVKLPPQKNKYEKAFESGYNLLSQHPLFSDLYCQVSINVRNDYNTNLCPRGGLAVITSRGELHVRPATMLLLPDEWAYVIAHSLLHLAFGHFQETYRGATWNAWNVACDCFILRFLSGLRFGMPPQEHEALLRQIHEPTMVFKHEQTLYEEFCLLGIPPELMEVGMTLSQNSDMILQEPVDKTFLTNCQEVFSRSLQNAVLSVVADSARTAMNQSSGFVSKQNSRAVNEARKWFITQFPLLGSLASAFTVVEDSLRCQQMNISIAAVDIEQQVIYINSYAGLEGQALRFVLAHEFLHAGLRHDVRCEGRDPYLWNIACDYVINGWLVEMGVGEMPIRGGMYDPALKNESAEAIYDRIVRNLRAYRKVITMRGNDQSDILGSPGWWMRGNGVDLDEFYRNSLSQGLQSHEMQGRGFLPAGLIEEIRALSQPPIPWDVQLAAWFDERFPPVEKRRSYARLSRRQSVTPDIPRPSWVYPEDLLTSQRRTYGVLLDTSGSMNINLLAKALGAIASYSIAREVEAVRVIFCDAATYDQGYMAPEDIAGDVKVRGRGGTILQPGINLLEHAEDFPADGPILIITDGYCDRLTIFRDHAYILPQNRTLPFPPHGPVFRIPDDAEV